MAPTILIVEDHDAVRRTLRDWIAIQFPHCRLIEAASGEKAVVLAASESPRLVVMDVSLPGMNGIQATARIKATTPAAQVVMLTIHEEDAYRTAAAAAGASAFVSKRGMQAELVATLARLLATTATDDPGSVPQNADAENARAADSKS